MTLMRVPHPYGDLPLYAVFYLDATSTEPWAKCAFSAYMIGVPGSDREFASNWNVYVDRLVEPMTEESDE